MTEAVYLLAFLLAGLGFCGLLITAIVAICFGRGVRLKGRVRHRQARADGSLAIDAEKRR